MKCTCDPEGAAVGSACEHHTALAETATDVKAAAVTSVYLALSTLGERQAESLYVLAREEGPCPEKTLISYGMCVALGVSVYGMTDFDSMDEAAHAGSSLLTTLAAADRKKRMEKE